MNAVILSQEQFNTLNEKIESILSKLSSGNINEGHLWLSSKETMKLLNIGQTTLWNYRNQGIIKASKINKKLYFYKPDILKLIESVKK